MPSIKTLETDRLVLRAPCLNDAENIQKYFNDWEVIKLLSNAIPWPYPENGAIDFLEKIVFPNQGKGRWIWGICFKDNPNEVIGIIDLWLKSNPENRGF